MSWRQSLCALSLMCLTQCESGPGPAGAGDNVLSAPRDRAGPSFGAAVDHEQVSDTSKTSSQPCSDATPAVAVDSLLWKRAVALSNDLQRGLQLSADELCSELGKVNCTDVHRVPLGRSDPFGTGLFEPVQQPLATTPLATDRVVLSACSQRVEKDKLAAPVVFKGMDLSDDPMPSSAQAQTELAQTVADILYPRLLARDATPQEAEVLRELAVDQTGEPIAKSVFAKLACFAVATTSEFVLY